MMIYPNSDFGILYKREPNLKTVINYTKRSVPFNKIKSLKIDPEPYSHIKDQIGIDTIEYEAVKRDHDVKDSFQRAFSQLLMVGQCFGVLPVAGVLESNPARLRFSWFTWRVGYTFICLIGSSLMTSLCIFRLFFTGSSIYKTINTMFYGSTMMVLILFLRLSSKWPSLAMAISEKERTNYSVKQSLRCRFNLYSFGILFPALIEHLLAVATCLAVAYDCSRGQPIVESYFVNAFPQIFNHIEFTSWIGFLVQFVNVGSTFNWNFMDLFLTLICLTLTDRFEQLNSRLDSVKSKNVGEDFWKSAREEYVHLSQLVKKIDRAINAIIFLSFTSNVYFICVQLFNSLKVAVTKGCFCSTFRRVVHVIYFMFSFIFLIMRFMTVSLGIAKVHTAARYPMTIMYTIPSLSYGIEQKRLLEQIITDMIAMSGLNFFYVTRGLVLTIAGTIITYELVLIQFNPSPEVNNTNITASDICGITIESLAD